MNSKIHELKIKYLKAPPGDYRKPTELPAGAPIFNSVTRAVRFTIYDHIFRLRQKR